jgi:tetratricopeptide (TPR) repeat protein
MLNKGFTLTVAKKFEAAEETYKRAIECSQNIEEPFDRLMKLWRARGKFKEVKDWCEQSLDYATAYISLALAKNALGDLEGAIETINIGSTRQDASEKKEYALLQGVLNALKSDSQCARTQTTKSKKNKPFEFLQYQRPVNPDLIAALHRVESRKLDLAPNSPVYGNGTCSVDYNFFKDAKHPAIQSMVQDLSEIMRQAVGSEILIFDSFFNFFDSGSGIPRHNHLGELDLEGPLNLRDQKYSLVYYLSVGSQDTTQPGQLLLHDPDEIIIPETGMVGIFPAGWSHSASYDGRSRRILVGANFYQL